ncbi:DUF4129 domain-containing protein [Microseira wollei]|uniref:Protein-glutamine gamma-glutamyltransferase-like C-terminal domain-containing protein n=1 Tax=Microseira wollei NIES-4236 TaxID=2530354 RepID=A0AAV3WID6_9CYAN|nr:DUF4129 domain-containing protein [Microseira wollei]GET39174.1 hypothetical protein LYNGBM3L_71170 [Microseira wollei NIES-4236]
MSTNAFEKTSLGWQLQQLQQRVGEWLELQLSQLRPRLPNLPNVSTPEWLNSLTWLLVRVAFWAILGWVLIRLVLWLMPQMQPYWNWLNLKPGRQTTVPESELTAETWLLRARELYRQSDYREAARALYMAMLQQLNDTRIVPHQPSRTDGEYIQLTQELPHHASYQILLQTHERLWFGNQEITPEAFEQCQQAYRDIQSANG